MYILVQLLPSETNATSIVTDGLRALCMWICQAIYPVFAFFYELFMNMTTVKILEQEDINSLYNRVTILLGVIMLFVSIFYLLRLLLTPDKISDKEQGMGNLIKKIIVVVLLIGFAPTIFDKALDIQQEIISSDVIPKVLLGKTFNEDSSSFSAAKYGRTLAANIFKIFYQENDNITDGTGCVSYQYIEDEMIQNGTLNIASQCVNKTGSASKEADPTETMQAYVINFDGIFAIIIGVVMLWMIVVYTIDVGIRIFQLTFLQIIAPVPIISYIYPKKDGMFQKWVKQCITTYLDLFIRLAIIYFVFYLLQLIWDTDILQNITSTTEHKNWICIILTIALMIFARRLPKILQELSGKPSAASIGFGIGGSNAAAGSFIGAATIGAMNFVGSTGAARFTGLVKGIVSGGWAGSSGENFSQNLDKAKQKAAKSNQIDEWLKMQGYHGFNRYKQRAITAAGGIPTGRRLEYQSFLDKNFKSQLKDDDRVKVFSTAKQQCLTYAGRADQFMENRGNGIYGLHDPDGKLSFTYNSNEGKCYALDYDENGNVTTTELKNEETGQSLSLYEALDKREKQKIQVVSDDKNEQGVQAAAKAMRSGERYTSGRKRAYIQDTVGAIIGKIKTGSIGYQGINYGRFNKNTKKTSGEATRNPGPSGSSGMPR